MRTWPPTTIGSTSNACQVPIDLCSSCGLRITGKLWPSRRRCLAEPYPPRHPRSQNCSPGWLESLPGTPSRTRIGRLVVKAVQLFSQRYRLFRPAIRDSPCFGGTIVNHSARRRVVWGSTCVFVFLFLLSAASVSPAQSTLPPPPPLLLGIAWYPEQWPQAHWDADLALMQRSGVHMVR